MKITSKKAKIIQKTTYGLTRAERFKINILQIIYLKESLLAGPSRLNLANCLMPRSRIHERHTISLRFLGIILRVLRLRFPY